MKKADRIRREIGKVNLVNTEHYVRASGIRLRYYGNDDAVDREIEAAGYKGYSERVSAFVDDHPLVKTIFVKDALPEDQKLLALLHELAHIVFGHNIGHTTDAEEREACRFARKCLSEAVPRWIRIMLITAIAMCGLFFAVIAAIQPSYPEADAIAGAQDAVYVTPSGDKYHRADCIYVEGREDIITLSRKEAVIMGKDACKVCKP